MCPLAQENELIKDWGKQCVHSSKRWREEGREWKSFLPYMSFITFPWIVVIEPDRIENHNLRHQHNAWESRPFSTFTYARLSPFLSPVQWCHYCYYDYVWLISLPLLYRAVTASWTRGAEKEYNFVILCHSGTVYVDLPVIQPCHSLRLQFPWVDRHIRKSHFPAFAIPLSCLKIVNVSFKLYIL